MLKARKDDLMQQHSFYLSVKYIKLAASAVKFKTRCHKYTVKATWVRFAPLLIAYVKLLSQSTNLFKSAIRMVISKESHLHFKDRNDYLAIGLCTTSNQWILVCVYEAMWGEQTAEPNLHWHSHCLRHAKCILVCGKMSVEHRVRRELWTKR